MTWNVVAQKSNRSMTLCKRVRLYPSDQPDGTVKWMPLKMRMWQILITDPKGLVLKVKMTLNEIGTPAFVVEHPEKQVYQTIKHNGRDIPIHDAHAPMLTVKGEVERYHTTKELKQRLAGFAGMSFANEVVGLFIQLTPLGDS